MIHSGTSDRRVQYSRVGLEVKIYDTPPGGLRASKGTFSSLYIFSVKFALKDVKLALKDGCMLLELFRRFIST